MRSIGFRWWVLSFLFVGVSSAFLSFSSIVRHVGGPLNHEAYVWQRQWDESVQSAVEGVGEEFQGLVALAAEVSFQGGEARIVQVPIEYPSLRQSGARTGLAIRIGPYSGPFDTGGPWTRRLVALAESMVVEASREGCAVSELQLDFDCAESRLDGYATWVRAVREAVHPVPLTITALPSWLHSRAFSRLASASDGYVLQVHSLERPETIQDEISICDAGKAAAWIEAAGRIGLPFRVALPTYGYLMVFDRDGRFKGLIAEGESPLMSPENAFRRAQADPGGIAGLVRALTASRPACMTGLLWYRLPTESDRLNWTRQTLACVMRGDTPVERLEARRVERPDGLVEILLANTGERTSVPAGRVDVAWGKCRLLAADACNGFDVTASEAGSLTLRSRNHPGALRPGEEWKIAWLRFADATEANSHVVLEIR